MAGILILNDGTKLDFGGPGQGSFPQDVFLGDVVGIQLDDYQLDYGLSLWPYAASFTEDTGPVRLWIDAQARRFAWFFQQDANDRRK